MQFGLCFSPNLGDGVISDCIAHGVTTKEPDATVTHVDLSARQSRGDVVIPNRKAILAILDRLPRVVRQSLTKWKLTRLMQSVDAQWEKAVDVDLAVIGGGQLFADANLNFPIKIANAARILSQKKTPTVVYAVGVSSNWSKQGADLFQSLQKTDLRMIGVRDDGSAESWRDQMPENLKPEITYDPGLLAASCYGEVAAKPKLVGLCITDFGTLTHHADGNVAGQLTGAVEFYAGIVSASIASGYSVALFSNGAAEDAALLQKVVNDPSIRGLEDVIVPKQPTTPRELAHVIAGCSAVIAHRLHACIVAYSYQRPVVGLGWDSKLQSFFTLANMPTSFSDAPNLDAAEIVGMVTATLEDGVSTKDHARMLGGAWDGIDRLLSHAKGSGAE